jgi:hypothetical protein
LVTAVDEFRDSVGAALLWLLMLPGVLPGLAVAVLVLGLRRARRIHRSVRYSFGVIATAVALVCFSLIPAYAKYVHARRPDEEWFWQLLGLVAPFVLLCIGLDAMARANKTGRNDFWDSH